MDVYENIYRKLNELASICLKFERMNIISKNTPHSESQKQSVDDEISGREKILMNVEMQLTKILDDLKKHNL